MIDTLALSFICASLLLALISPFLPQHLMWRGLFLAGLAFMTGSVLTGPVHWSNRDLGYAITFAFFGYFCGAIGIVVTIRVIIEAIYRHVRRRQSERKPRTKWVDLVIAVAMGGVSGLLLLHPLAALTGGHSGGLALDLVIGCTAAGIAAFLGWRLRGYFDVGGASAALTIAMMSFVGSAQTQSIIDHASELANGRAWCLTMPTKPDSTVTRSDLGFYALPKGKSSPHLVLVIEGERDMLLWSIRRQAFGRGNIGLDTHCDPAKGHEAL
ncbi:hypothetical protein [Rhizobium sp. AAP43]|uniref:hypothetical protein n=1 Tax=Rhizobium sp. AAP43 TaxID=1523420 RepID=UPI0006B8A37A|nr:hypothetical protein [Rhizobium sp. AAP43]KPF42264.1 hypothetical protein IP76_17805 [Rhizobium sp. AAP43]